MTKPVNNIVFVDRQTEGGVDAALELDSPLVSHTGPDTAACACRDATSTVPMKSTWSLR